MKKNPILQSGTLNPRVLLALALCSIGTLLAMFSVEATPTQTKRANTDVPLDSPNFSNTLGSNTNRLPSGVPLPLGSRFSVNAFDTSTEGWSLVDSPNNGVQKPNVLSGVACPSPSECWAVGHYFNDVFISQTLIQRWDGTSWTIASSPNTDTAVSNSLNGVTCVSASECWAVGSYLGQTSFQTLIEHWDGTSWTIVTSPNTDPTQNNSLNAVTCVSASECWAVGTFAVTTSNTISQTLTEHWDGTSWTIVNSPNTSDTDNNFLNGVTCVSESDCWAAGVYNLPKTTTSQTLIEHWDGTSWTIVSSPNNQVMWNNNLYGVACSSAVDCWAVGNYYNSTKPSISQTLIERWDGTSWTIASSPNTDTTQKNFLNGVTCASASECWAVGNYYSTEFPLVSKTLIQSWDGTSWTIVSSPDTGADPVDTLFGVTCASASDCWSVGVFNVSNGPTTWTETLTINYTASAPTPTPTPTTRSTPTPRPRPTPAPRPTHVDP
jgi:hypothetical protein